MPVKTLMNILGMPAGPVRQPLGKMTHAGVQKVLAAARQVHANDPTALAPIAEFFGVDVEARLHDDSLVECVVYPSY